MPKIVLKNVSLNYPLLGGTSRSIKKKLINFSTFGKVLNSSNVTFMPALKNISFSLEQGDFLGLIGNNGAGKSTLLKLIANIYEVSEGQVSIDGTVSALLGASVGLQVDLNGPENIKLNAILRRHSKNEIQNIINDVEDFTELGGFFHLPIKTYSAGMQARLAFGISTAVHPDILVIDELIGTGDANFIKKAKSRMETLLHHANILVLASHSTEIIKQFCNKAMWLENGEIKSFGNVDDVIAQYHNSLAQ